ncbi:hypothetical protein KDK95_09900 [Actinospica sp. MGRD01-02]|uniref:Uncharacterized protein n=1 Tax=Actinospica acidithermotolerans TaxID=2828514 RepID=A0A941IIB6_9ACTN|nr:hypothetical protein [Actinospica acidithermotolerans]MBR7826617.1 hypothetical protein [Actinospica acidithermotolerans]
MPENTPPNTPQRVAPAPANHADQAQKAVAVAVGASAILTAGWVLLSGLTGRHYTIVLPLIGAAIALALTSTPARRPWFPVLAAVLGFAVGYLGDIAAVTLLLWRDGVSLTVIANHAPALVRAVNDGHSASDWAFFLGSAAIAAAATAARQKARPTHAEPAEPR